MSGGLAPAIGQELIQRIEDHCVRAWPATIIERPDDGWILRATPGLHGRGRSNHALAPVRSLSSAEIDVAIGRAVEFAERHGVECGLQVGPLELHIPLLDEVAARGWEIQPSVLVMMSDTRAAAQGHDPDFELTVTDHATPAWLHAWSSCEPGRANVNQHVETVFQLMAGPSAHFMHHGDSAVGIAVEHDGIAGLFCLAVNPERRRQGLGKKLVRGMLSRLDAPITYLQVFSHNDAGLALYNSLGFQEVYRYLHCVAPGQGGGPDEHDHADTP